MNSGGPISPPSTKSKVLDPSLFGLEMAKLVEEPAIVLDLAIREGYLSFRAGNGASRCVACKGARMLCGKARCPILARISSFLQVAPKISSETLAGSTPPGVFVGRIGYPYVYVGPLTPPFLGDTTLLDLPELWVDRKIEEIVAFRSMLVRGKTRAKVSDAGIGGRILDAITELALASKPVDLELTFDRPPRGSMLLDDEVQPFGPSAIVKKMKVGEARWDRSVEKVYEDTDLKASEAVLTLYKDGILVSKIQRAFSIGALGLKTHRRLVPTRWSITAVDSIISNALMERVRSLPIINEYRLYEYDHLDNRFEILMIPSSWSYESIEAWYPRTVWNPWGKEIVYFGDYEGYGGRTTYASMGGCYYAGRLAVTEHLVGEGRQASVLILREIHPGYILPVGVWNVRESVRSALRHPPLKFNNLEEALRRIADRLEIRLDTWLRASRMLRIFLHQKRMRDFLEKI
jgi:hypothetical protein